MDEDLIAEYGVSGEEIMTLVKAIAALIHFISCIVPLSVSGVVILNGRRRYE